MRSAVIFFLFFCVFGEIIAQSPTTGDCLGAFTVCQETYDQSASFVGEGNYPAEIDPNAQGNCLTSGEKNNAWYMITVQAGGRFGFNINPKCPDADYDWALFDLTNATCAEITTNPTLLVACNYRGATFPTPTTGMNDGPNPQDEDMINVTAGKVYALIVNNFSGIGQCGYILDFKINEGLPNASTADIIDDVPPVLIPDQNTPLGCGSKTVSFCFSEYVKCSTVIGNKFRLISPAGDTIKGVSVTSKACGQGGKMEKCFTVTLEKPIFSGGDYIFQSFGKIEDLCGNIAPAANITFTLPKINLSFSTTPVDCALKNGTATATVLSGGQAPYSFSWKTNPVQNTSTATGLTLGRYLITVTDSKGCFSVDSVNLIDKLPSVKLNMSSTDAICSSKNGTATAGISSGGTAPFLYSWNTSPVQTSSTATGLEAGKYKVRVTDSKGCAADDSVVVKRQNISILLNLTSTPVNCTLKDGTATASVVSGGTAPYSFIWLTQPQQTSATATGLDEGTFVVVVADAQGCSATDSITLINQVPKMNLGVTTTPVSCTSNNGSATVVVSSGGAPPFSYSWDTNPPQNTATAINLPPGSFKVTVTDSKGCKAETSAVLSNPNNLVLKVTSLPDTCSSGRGSAQAQVTGGSPPYVFDWPGGNPNSNNFKGLSTGNYSLKVTDAGGCIISQAYVVGDTKDIKASFSFNPSRPNILSPLVNFINTTANSTDTFWDFSTGDTSIQANPQYIFPPVATTYNVTLIVKSKNGCIDSTSRAVKIESVYTLYAPDSFTPNDDNQNDTFRVYISGIDMDSYNLAIFNRWGEELFSTTDVNEGWSGKAGNNNAYCPSGVYALRIRFTDLSGKKHVVHGKVVLIG